MTNQTAGFSVSQQQPLVLVQIPQPVPAWEKTVRTKRLLILSPLWKIPVLWGWCSGLIPHCSAVLWTFWRHGTYFWTYFPRCSTSSRYKYWDAVHFFLPILIPVGIWGTSVFYVANMLFTTPVFTCWIFLSVPFLFLCRTVFTFYICIKPRIVAQLITEIKMPRMICLADLLTVVGNHAIFFINLTFIFVLCVDVLPSYLFSTCLQYLQRPEEGLRSSGNGVTVVNYLVSAGKQTWALCKSKYS